MTSDFVAIEKGLDFSVNKGFSLPLALEALRDEGIKVPEEMAIVGFDDIEMAGIPGVDLTTISQKKSALGRTAVDMFINRIRGQFNQKVKRILLEPTLVIRRTCGYPLSGERYGVHSQTQ